VYWLKFRKQKRRRNNLAAACFPPIGQKTQWRVDRLLHNQKIKLFLINPIELISSSRRWEAVYLNTRPFSLHSPSSCFILLPYQVTLGVGLFLQAHLLLFEQRVAQGDLWRERETKNESDFSIAFVVQSEITCLSLKDRFCFPLAFCFNIMKFFFLLFSRFVVLALGFWRLGFLVGFSRSARPSYIDNKSFLIDISIKFSMAILLADWLGYKTHAHVRQYQRKTEK
jgi:hypothetical protein